MGELEPGVLLVDKAAGRTSFSVVRELRKLTGIKKIGHAGTLDPFATGLLVMCLGRQATRLSGVLMEGSKEYHATIILGSVSTTLDPEGEITRVSGFEPLPAGRVTEVLTGFTGTIMQKPPLYSALKHKGRPLYDYARRGEPVEKPPRPVTIESLRWLNPRPVIDDDDRSLVLRVRCGKGTYIRSLAADIGEKLGTGGYLAALRRERSGPFSVNDGVATARLEAADSIETVRASMIGLAELRKILRISDKVATLPIS
jgi:tRNA pseudouridine55 synthase